MHIVYSHLRPFAAEEVLHQLCSTPPMHCALGWRARGAYSWKPVYVSAPSFSTHIFNRQARIKSHFVPKKRTARTPMAALTTAAFVIE